MHVSELYNSTMEEASVEENSTSGSDFYTDINANLTLETLVNDTSVEPENSTVDYADVSNVPTGDAEQYSFNFKIIIPTWYTMTLNTF